MTAARTATPQSVDPLSWFTGPPIAVVLSGVAVAQGLATTIVHWDEWSSAALQLLALPLLLVAGYLIFSATRPTSPPFTASKAIPALAVVCLSLAFSAAGLYGGSVSVETWWAPVAVGLAISSLAPYSSARHLVMYCVPVVALASALSFVIFVPTESFWQPLSTVLIAIAPILVASIAAVVFSSVVVSRTRQYANTPSDQTDVVAADIALKTHLLAHVSARVVPFLESVADAGVITDTDRGLAAHLARRLRADLVSRVNMSWLEAVAREFPLVVSDPEHLADVMNEAQRAALRALLTAVFESPVVDRESVLIELRSAADGAAAVALSIDIDLPEGRRVALLAPYYLTLQTTVGNLSWQEGQRLLLKFQVSRSGRP